MEERDSKQTAKMTIGYVWSKEEEQEESRYAQRIKDDLRCETLADASLAKKMDEEDELKSFRERFNIPHKVAGDSSSGVSVYFCGNSLGAQPKNSVERVQEELNDWAKWGVEGHWNSTRPWLTTDEYAFKLMANVVGAKPEEVAVMNSLTVNLHMMLIPFYKPNLETKRTKLVIEAKAFPSDLYATQSQVRLHGLDPEEHLVQIQPLEDKEQRRTLLTEQILELIEREGDTIACICLSGVQYYTGQYFEIERITRAAHEKGVVVGFDLAHAVGNAPLRLHDWNVDFAVWCSYKYLNSGPGSIAGCFVHENWHSAVSSGEKPYQTKGNRENFPGTRLAGWWGHDLKTRFEMDEPFTPIPGAFGFRMSNPPVFQVASLIGSLELFEAATMERLRRKSLRMTGYLEAILVESGLLEKHIRILTPSDPSQRGCQLSLLFLQEGAVKKVNERLLKMGVICDVRKPDVIRAAPVPLYNSYEDVRLFVEYVKQALM